MKEATIQVIKEILPIENADQIEVFCHVYGLKMVPVIEIENFSYTLEQLLEKAKGVYTGTKNRREGVVIRPYRVQYSEVLRKRLSVKALNNDYLLREDD